MILMIDNYDSFTFNLVLYLQELQQQVHVIRNDAITCEEIRQLAPTHLIISPGPGRPEQAGISLKAVETCAAHIPILGVCLGHQSIAQAFGARVVRAPHVVHGKTSRVEHLGTGLFKHLEQPLKVARYHSLIVDEVSLPDSLQADAWSLDAGGKREYMMGLRHRTRPIFGVQFHPEAILTRQGHQLLRNFLRARGDGHHPPHPPMPKQGVTP